MPDPTETAKPVPPLEPGRIHEHSGRRVGGVETVPGGPHPDAPPAAAAVPEKAPRDQ